MYINATFRCYKMHVNVVIFYNLGEYHTDGYATMTTTGLIPPPIP